MNKQILGSLNKICAELDAYGMHKESSSLTNVFFRLAAKRKFEFSYVVVYSDKIVVDFRDSSGPSKRETNNPETNQPFRNVDEAYTYARKNSLRKPEILDQEIIKWENL